MDHYINDSQKQEIEVESDEFNFNTTEMSLKDEIDEGEYCIQGESIESETTDHPVPTKRASLRFSPATTTMLLREYRKRIDQFRDRSIKNNLIWEEIVNEFHKKNYHTTVRQLTEKFRNLKKFFLVVKDNENITWKYFKIFSQIMGIEAEANNSPSDSFGDDQQSIKNFELMPNLKFTEIKHKFKNAMILKRKPGRPRKIKSPSIDHQDVKLFENGEDNQTFNSDNLDALSSDSINIEKHAAISNMNNDLKGNNNTSANLPTLKLSRIYNKFKFKTNLTQIRGRPPKKKYLSTNRQDVKAFENYGTGYSTNLMVLLPPGNMEIPIPNAAQQKVSPAPEIPLLDPVQPPMLTTDEINVNTSETSEDKKICIAPTLTVNHGPINNFGLNYKFKKTADLKRKRGRPKKKRNLMRQLGWPLNKKHSSKDDQYAKVFENNKTPNFANIEMPLPNTVQQILSPCSEIPLPDPVQQQMLSTDTLNENPFETRIDNETFIAPDSSVNHDSLKRDDLPTLQFSRINYKFKKTTDLKRKRGRPRKELEPLVDSGSAKDFENNYTCDSTNLITNSQVNHEIPEVEPNINDDIKLNNNERDGLLTFKFTRINNTFKKTVAAKPKQDWSAKKKRSLTDDQDVNAAETDKNNEIDIGPKIVPSSPVNHEIQVEIPHMIDELINPVALPTLKFTKINNKFKKIMTLKRKRGRPRKKRNLPKNAEAKNKFENNKESSTYDSTDIAVSAPYSVNIEIPSTNSAHQKIPSTGTQDFNTSEKEDNEISITSRIVSLSPGTTHEIPAAIPNINEQLSEFQKRILQIEEEKRDELIKLRLAVEKNTKLLERMCEKISNSQLNC